MSIYDRAPRKPLPIVGCTLPCVGPGSYKNFNEKYFFTGGYAPFLSMSERDTLSIPDTLMHTPGPGHYNSQLPPSRIQGGNSLQNTSERFKSATERAPGPGSYNVLHSDILKTASIPPAWDERQREGKSRIKFIRQPEAPSIPIPRQAYGFEENEDGTLIKQEPPSRDQTMGPAYYAPKDKLSKDSTKHYDFSKAAQRRSLFDNKMTPGPGAYDLNDETTRYTTQHLNMQNDQPASDQTQYPRFADPTITKAYKEGYPGPGRYNIRSTISAPTPKYNAEGKPIEPAPFLTHSTRFSDSTNKTPGPGAYLDPRHALEILNRVTGLKKSPFGKTATRFEKNSNRTPGPGTYNCWGMGVESLRKAYLESTQRGIFGTSSARNTGLYSKKDVNLPGPADYQIKEVHRRPNKPQAHIHSTSKRLADVPHVDKPSPDAYDVIKSFENSQIKCQRTKPRTKAARLKQGSFTSADSRFGVNSKTAWYTSDPDNPAPGSYNPSSVDNNKSAFFGNSKRFQAYKSDDFPGPGHYQLSSCQRDTVVKGTFNTTLSNIPQESIQCS